MKTKSSDWMNVTLHGRQGYAKDVGKYRTAAGKLAYKRFWLGSELEPARFAAFTICKAWAAIRASGRELWEQKDIDGVKMMVEGPANLMKQALQGVAERKEQVRLEQEQIDRHQQSITELSFMVTGATVSTETVPAPLENRAMTFHEAIDAFVKWTRARGDLSESYRPAH